MQPQASTLTRASRTRAAFTLVEILVVVLIIGLLIGILIPTVSRVRQSGWAASTSAQIASLAAAIERYRLDHGAYPGPLHNDQIGPSSTFQIGVAPDPQGRFEDQPSPIDGITMSENLVLALLGGLRWENDVVIYDPALVGQGPQNLGIDDRRSEPYVEAADLSWQTNADGRLSGIFWDDAAEANDTLIPEFVDRFPNALPILYLRARVGASGIIAFNGNQQYDLEQIIAYTGTNIGIGREFPVHGLRTVDPSAELGSEPNDAHAYLRHPSLPGVPRQRDGFILISAGRDRTYGTHHDITSFGNLD